MSDIVKTLKIGHKAEKLKTAFKDAGIHGLMKIIENDLNEWKNEKVNIAVAGEAGSGKSTFINAIRGLTADKEGAAPVGSTTTTIKCRRYAHPHNSNVSLWDLPGIGTEGFPKETYVTDIKLAEYDSFLILSCKRFTENDEFLAHEIEKVGKRFYFVRTQFGNDIENESNKRGKSVDENELKHKINIDCQEKLANFKSKPDIFVIDSYEKNYYDFDHLARRLMRDFENTDEKKQVALTLTLSAMTVQVIEEKKATLEKRITRTALKAAFAPRFFGSDIQVLMEEKDFYIKQFAIDDQSLKRDTDAAGIRNELKDICSELKRNKDSFCLDLLFNKELDILIPFLTSFINIPRTYSAGKVWLKQTLDGLAKVAIDINKRMVEGVARDRFTTEDE